MEETIQNEHDVPNLKKQIVGLVIVSLIFLIFSGPFLILQGVLTFIDAWKAGIYKKKGKSTLLNLSPLEWACVMEGLFVLAYPFYVLKRNKLKTKPGHSALFRSVILLGGFIFLFQIGGLWGKYQEVRWSKTADSLMTSRFNELKAMDYASLLARIGQPHAKEERNIDGHKFLIGWK